MTGALRRTWGTARAQPSGHMGVVLTMAASLALLGLFAQLTGGARRVVEGWGQAARLRCELDGELSRAAQEATREALAALPGVGGPRMSRLRLPWRAFAPGARRPGPSSRASTPIFCPPASS